MIEIAGLPVLRMPARQCCNCSTLAGLKIVRSRVARLPSNDIDGSRSSLTLPLPFCPRCLPSAARERPSKSTLIALSVMFGLLIMTVALVLAKARSPDHTGIFALLGFIAGPALVLGLIARTRPQRPQTSYFCPVWIEFGTNLMASKIREPQICFSNPDYARAFEAGHAGSLGSGEMGIRVVRQ